MCYPTDTYFPTSVQTFLNYKPFCHELFSHCKLPISFTDYLSMQSTHPMWSGTQMREWQRNLLKNQPCTHKKKHLKRHIMSRLGFFWRRIHANQRKLNREQGKASSCIMARASCSNGSFKSTVPYSFFIDYALSLPSVSIPTKTKC